MAAGRLPWGKDHHRVYRTLLYHRLLNGVAREDLPEKHNRVTLEPVLKDGHGIPAPRVDDTISENTRRMMEDGIARGQFLAMHFPSANENPKGTRQYGARYKSGTRN